MNFELYENLDYEYINNLYNLAKANPSNLTSVKNIYLRDNKYLQENLNFLINIKLFEINENHIIINKSENGVFRELIISLILQQPDYASCIKNYLSNFQEGNDGNYFFTPDGSYNIESSDLRNFLITLKYLKNINDSYILIDKSILKKFKNRKYSPEELKKRLMANELLGFEAEKLIMEYETTRIKKFANELKPIHVALSDVSAGYDIQSYEVKNKKLNKIFIEVKAVSKSNYKFHFSSLEYQTSLKLKDSYYIYLLPVDHSQTKNFDIEKLLKINDVYKNIFTNKREWNTNEDGYIISRAKD